MPLTALQARFVAEYLIDLNATQAARRAGVQAQRLDQAGYELLRKPEIAAEVKAGLAERAERTQITQDMVVAELKKIGFADIRKAVKWNGMHVTERDNDEGGDIAIIKETRTNLVLLVDSDQLDDDTAAAISEISQSESGGVKVKFHDKRQALVDLGRHLGMFKDNLDLGGKVEIEHSDARSRVADRVNALARKTVAGEPPDGSD